MIGTERAAAGPVRGEAWLVALGLDRLIAERGAAVRLRVPVGALALVAALAASCSSGSDSDAGALPDGGGPGATSGSVAAEGFAFAEPGTAAGPSGRASAEAVDADPRTPLGELRAAHLPVWDPELDWAFPPEVCHSAWDLDAVAAPVEDSAGSSVSAPFLTAPVPVAAALAVMRYERLFSTALVAPGALAQLCVAVAAVEPARSHDLAVLASYLETGSRRAEPARHPEEVTVVAVAPTLVLAAACVEPGYPAVVTADGGTRSEPRAPARLQAYILRMARGIEDDVVDFSLRVSATYHRPAEDCGELAAWTGEWRGQAEQWASEGRLWELIGATVTAEELCGGSSPGSAPESVRECPADWP